MKKLLHGELLEVRTDQAGISFYKQNSQALRAFVSWEDAFGKAMEITPPAKSGECHILDFGKEDHESNH